MPPRSQAARDPRKDQVLAEQIRLLYANRDITASVTIVATVTVGRLQWNVAPRPVVLGWCLYMILVAAARP